MFISLRNATKKYGERESLVYALDHMNLEIGKGEICVIIGPSGSGKSTLLNMLGGLDHLDEGEIIVGGTFRGTKTICSRIIERKMSGLFFNFII